MRIRRGDVVEVIAGDDLGKRGKILRVLNDKNRAIVEGINFVYHHQRPGRRNPQGGRIQREAPVAMSNLLPVCSKCNRGVRTRRRQETEGRMCARCGETIGAD